MKRSHAVQAVIIVLAAVIAMFLLEVGNDILPFVDFGAQDDDVIRLMTAVLAILVTWVVLSYVGETFEKITTPKISSHAQARSLWKMISYVVWIFVLSIVIISLVGEVSSLVLSIGLIGAALTFVLQRPLLNIGGWALVSFRRLYRIGDRISLGGVKGYVLDISMMYTELREFGEWMKGDTFTGRIVIVPNSVIFEQPVFNYTKDFPFIWDEIGNLVTYESDIDVAKTYMLDSAREVVGKLMAENYDKYRDRMEIRDLHELLLREPELRMELSDSGVNVYVLYFCPVSVRRKIKAEITERIWRKFMSDPRVGIAYPHMHLVGDLDK